MLQQLIMRNKKTSAIILAGAAAFAYYKYSKMNPVEKERMRTMLKDKSKGILGSIVPFGLGNVFSKSSDKTQYKEQPVM